MSPGLGGTPWPLGAGSAKVGPGPRFPRWPRAEPRTSDRGRRWAVEGVVRVHEGGAGGLGGGGAIGERGESLWQRAPGLGAEAQDAGDSVPNRSLVFTVVHPNPTSCWG